MKIQKLLPFAVVLVALAVAAGCTTDAMRTVTIDNNTKPDQSAGVAYNLPKGYVHIVGDLQQPAAGTSGPRYYKLTVTPNIVPDTSVQYVLQADPSIWSHDTYGITVTNGLLTTINATNASQLHDIFVSLATTAGIAAAMAAPLVATNNATPVAQPDVNAPPHFEIDLDPAQDSDVKLGGNATLLQAKIKPFLSSTATTYTQYTNAVNEGLLYHPLGLYQVAINNTAGNDAQTVIQTEVLLPNPNITLSISPEHTPMLARNASINFDHGVVTGFSFDRPSEVLAWASLPLDMIKAFISAPAELIQLKLNVANTNNALATAQTTALQDQLSSLQAQMSLQQFAATNRAAK